MAKKCAPGVICIENMTLLLLLIIIIIIAYLFYINFRNSKLHENEMQKMMIQSIPMMTNISTRHDIFNDPYAPPLKENGYFFHSGSSDIRGQPPIHVPVNIETRGLSTPYGQVGILTNTGRGDNLILPLMGRRHMTGRDKWLYYTISNTGSLNTKLPISVNGKGCDSEYGCDPIMQGDSVYVEGYKDTFTATIYENNAFRYIPY